MPGHKRRSGGEPGSNAGQKSQSPLPAWSAGSPDVDLFIRETRRRVRFIFRLNVCLSITLAVVLVVSTITAVILGFTGHELPATALGTAGLIPAAVCRPLNQISRAFAQAVQADVLLLSGCQRLRTAAKVKQDDVRAAAAMRAWGDIVTDVRAFTKEYGAERQLTDSIAGFLDRR
jgi:hypothetical protein